RYASHSYVFSGKIEVGVQVHVDHRIGFVPRDEWMGWLVNHSNLFEVGSASENLTGTIQIRSVANPDHRNLACRYEIAPLEGSRCFYAIDYFRASHLQYGARDIRLHPTLRLGHSANN